MKNIAHLICLIAIIILTYSIGEKAHFAYQVTQIENIARLMHDPNVQMDYRFDRVLELCQTKSYYGNMGCFVRYLQTTGDYACDEGHCGGGNSIGWYENWDESEYPISYFFYNPHP